MDIYIDNSVQDITDNMAKIHDVSQQVQPLTVPKADKDPSKHSDPTLDVAITRLVQQAADSMLL